MGLAAQRAQRLHLRGDRRGAGRDGLPGGARPLRRARLHRAAHRPPVHQPVPPAGRRRRHRADRRPGDDQHRRRGRAAAGDRPAAAAHLRRRQRARGDPGHDRDAGLVRPRRAGRGPGPARPSARPTGPATLGSAAAAAGRAPGRRPAGPEQRDGGDDRADGASGQARRWWRMAELRSVVLAGGGTGGHIYPLLAFADCLRRHQPDLRITCVGSTKGLEGQLIPAAGLRTAPGAGLPAAPFGQPGPGPDPGPDAALDAGRPGGARRRRRRRRGRLRRATSRCRRTWPRGGGGRPS